MAIWGCDSPACCCQPAVSGGFIYADLWSELITLLALQALFTQSSPGHDATATSFPLSKHTGGGDTAPVFSGLHVYLQFMWEVGFPPSPVEFSSHRHFYKLSHSWLLGVCRHSCLLQPACYEGAQDALPTFLRVFFLVIAFYSVSLFSLGGGRSVQGTMLIWPRVVCGSTVVPLSSPCGLWLPSHLGAAVWQCGSPLGFSL
jgi:hypothetical protein